MRGAYLRLKACPRCGGDILVDRAIEEDEVCIQCGCRRFGRTTRNTRPQNQLGKTVTVVNGQANREVSTKL
jgi:transcription initiation factor TFIIIB Brf1 subunit/transcription initiation factor TFIIB